MGDDFKLQPKHYYIAIALVSITILILAVDVYNVVTYESPMPSIDNIMWEGYGDVTPDTEQVELYYELDSEEILYHPYGDYDSGWEVVK